MAATINFFSLLPSRLGRNWLVTKLRTPQPQTFRIFVSTVLHLEMSCNIKSRSQETRGMRLGENVAPDVPIHPIFSDYLLDYWIRHWGTWFIIRWKQPRLYSCPSFPAVYYQKISQVIKTVAALHWPSDRLSTGRDRPLQSKKWRAREETGHEQGWDEHTEGVKDEIDNWYVRRNFDLI